MMLATEWLKPTRAGALGSCRLRTHSIQLRTCSEVIGSPPVLALVDIFTALASDCSGNRFACIPISLADPADRPPSGEILLVSRLIMPPFEK